MQLIHALEQKKNFTETEALIADYILNNRLNIPDMNISDLAKETFTSNPAIIRLCKKLGLDGYKSFRIAFAAELERQPFSITDIDYNYPFSSHESASSIMKTIATLSREAISTCEESLSSASLYSAARWLKNAKNIYIYALGDTYINALSFSNMVVKLGIHCIMANQFNESVSISYSTTSEDVALFLSYSGDVLSEFSTDLKVLKSNKCKTILVSSLEKTNSVDLLINFPYKERITEKVGGFYSQSAIRYILNILYGLIFTFNSEANIEMKNTAEILSRAQNEHYT